jgi:hypothetical protein
MQPDEDLIVSSLIRTGWRKSYASTGLGYDMHLSYRNPLDVIVDLKRLVGRGNLVLTLDDRRACQKRAFQLACRDGLATTVNAIERMRDELSVRNYLVAYTRLSAVAVVSLMTIEAFDQRLFSVASDL